MAVNADIEKIIEGQKQVILHLHRMSEISSDGDAPYYEELRDYAEEALVALDEQNEETEFIYNEFYVPTCKACGFRPFIGYIPKIEWMKEWGYKKCPNCGKTIRFPKLQGSTAKARVIDEIDGWGARRGKDSKI